jgi:8-oxo-dGTP pyrophosphatase MutT (NUDIX family)
MADSGEQSGQRAGTAQPQLRPRDAATLILIDRSEPLARVLMGRRRDDQVFLPGRYVFPGGGVDKADRRAPAASELAASEVERLLFDMKGEPSPGRARALALAAVRETFEETGIAVGERAADAVARGGPEGWKAFLESGCLPAVAPLRFIARAITPPGSPRRYDTRFFAADARLIGSTIDRRDGEFTEVRWVTFEEARGLRLATITRVVLEDLQDRLSGGDASFTSAPVPYYYQSNGSFRRDLIGR